jgi:hypothetical protein
MPLIETQVNARVERTDEVSVVYADADFKVVDGALVASRDGETMAWYAQGVWSAVIFGVVPSD